MIKTEKGCRYPQRTSSGLYSRCWSRDFRKCPSCASLHSLYIKKIISSGFEKADNNFYLLTLTAPSFGRIHAVPHSPTEPVRQCACGAVHDVGDAVAGVPLDLSRYRYGEAVLWNNTSSKLFSKTMTNLSEQFDNLSYFSVREYQKRGNIHYHVLLRISADHSPTDVVAVLKKAIFTKFKNTTWGRHIDAQLLNDSDSQQTIRFMEKVARYMSKDYSDESEDSEVQKEFYKRLDRAASKHHWTQSVISKFGFNGNGMTYSNDWSELSVKSLKEETRQYAIANNSEKHNPMKVLGERNHTELVEVAERLGSLQDYTVPMDYAASVRARLGLSTSVETD